MHSYFLKYFIFGNVLIGNERATLTLLERKIYVIVCNYMFQTRSV